MDMMVFRSRRSTYHEGHEEHAAKQQVAYYQKDMLGRSFGFSKP